MSNQYYFGTTRFSVFMPESRAWILSRDTEKDEYWNKLFSDERLETRFYLFFKKAVPIYQEMSIKYNYKHIVYYSKAMPEKWKSLLFEYAEKYPVLFLEEVSDSLNPVPIIARLLDGEPSGSVTVFRVDDDDILSSDYLDRLSVYSENPSFEGMVVSFGKGLFATYENGNLTHFKEVRHILSSRGQAAIGRYDAELKKINLPRRGAHSTVDTRTPTIIDSRQPSFIWVHHADQDLRTHSDKEKINKRVKKAYEELGDIGRGVDIKALFPTISF